MKSLATSVIRVKRWNSLGQEPKRCYSIHKYTKYVKIPFLKNINW